jgi:predicted 3-demethylubiquinone-9 3-methyltransferase (glyoxalase superfamily)
MTATTQNHPHLWFDTQAKAAAEFYVDIFPNSAVQHLTVLRDTPSGDCDLVTFTLAGQPFQAISAGPFFPLNPSVSFTVHCATAEEVDALWARLSDGGVALMPLDAYPFSPHFGWVQDRFGVSWQVILGESPAGAAQRIVPSLMFTGDNFGKALAAINFVHCDLPRFRSRAGDAQPGRAGKRTCGTVMTANFALEGQWFAIFDSGYAHGFNFNEAISFIVNCETQAEIDHYWEQLSAVPEAEQCGWLKDKFGLSWQIVPTSMDVLMREGSPTQVASVTQAFMPMKKLDIAAIERAYHAAASRSRYASGVKLPLPQPGRSCFRLSRYAHKDCTQGEEP